MFEVYKIETQGLVNFVLDATPYSCKVTRVHLVRYLPEARSLRDLYAKQEGGLWYRRCPSWFRYMDHARCTQVEVAKSMDISVSAFSKRLQRARAWVYPWPYGLEEYLEDRMILQPVFNRGRLQ